MITKRVEGGIQDSQDESLSKTCPRCKSQYTYELRERQGVPSSEERKAEVHRSCRCAREVVAS